MSEPQGAPRVRIWDAPTRIFHWSTVLLIPFLWWTAREGRMDLHIPAGLTMFGLVAFRLIWGLWGGSTARFAGFVKGPRAIAASLRDGTATIGHSPLGALSVVAMLAGLAAQVGLGLFATDEDGINTGPLAHLVSYETSEMLTEWHETVFNLLLGLIGVHLSAILFYLFVRRRNLASRMVTGAGEGTADGAALRPAPIWRFWATAGASAALALWMDGFFQG